MLIGAPVTHVTESLNDDEVHVWMTSPDGVRDPDLLQAYSTLLTTEEEARYRRFLFERHRRDFLIARACVRTALSRYEDVAPADWRFKIGEHGRPEISKEFGTELRFNLSHTYGLIAIGITKRRDIGVDVEATTRRAETVALAERYFSAAEVRELLALPEEQQRDRFFAYWTLKESYIKARGLGLVIPLGQFSFHLEDGQPVRISFDDRIDDRPEDWQFYHRVVGTDHRMALAMRRGTEPVLHVTENSVIPMRESLDA